MISAEYKSAYQQGYSDAMRDFRKQPSIDRDIEQIRAAIYKKSVQMHFDGNFYIKIDDVLQIIDKYTRGGDL